jgi:carotenoid cleavage dioxygenase
LNRVYLAGCFLRNGPNAQFDPPSAKHYHWFDGDGMIHQVQFDQGKATYHNKWIETKGLLIEREEGQAIWKGYKSPPDFNNPHGMAMKNLANTAMVYHNEKLLALWEAGSPHEIALPSLDTVGMYTFDGQWAEPVTAHPKVDPVNGDLVLFYYNPIMQPYVKIAVFDKNGKLKHQTGVELPKPVMIHDCAITENYVIVMDMPITFSMERAMSGGLPFDWEPSNGARVGLCPRNGDGKDTIWFEVEMGYVSRLRHCAKEQAHAQFISIPTICGYLIEIKQTIKSR